MTSLNNLVWEAAAMQWTGRTPEKFDVRQKRVAFPNSYSYISHPQHWQFLPAESSKEPLACPQTFAWWMLGGKRRFGPGILACHARRSPIWLWNFLSFGMSTWLDSCLVFLQRPSKMPLNFTLLSRACFSSSILTGGNIWEYCMQRTPSVNSRGFYDACTPKEHGSKINEG